MQVKLTTAYKWAPRLLWAILMVGPQQIDKWRKPIYAVAFNDPISP